MNYSAFLLLRLTCSGFCKHQASRCNAARNASTDGEPLGDFADISDKAAELANVDTDGDDDLAGGQEEVRYFEDPDEDEQGDVEEGEDKDGEGEEQEQESGSDSSWPAVLGSSTLVLTSIPVAAS